MTFGPSFDFDNTRHQISNMAAVVDLSTVAILCNKSGLAVASSLEDVVVGFGLHPVHPGEAAGASATSTFDMFRCCAKYKTTNFFDSMDSLWSVQALF